MSWSRSPSKVVTILQQHVSAVAQTEQSGTSKSLSSFAWLPEITGLEDEEEHGVAVSW